MRNVDVQYAAEGARRGRTRDAARALALLALVVSAGACSAIRFGGPDHDLAGSWDGSVTTEDQRIPGTLAVEQEGRGLDAAFVAPDFGLNAEGAGEVEDDGDFWLELDYDVQCPGNARLEGTVSEDGNRLSGTLEAVDCTGTTTGTFLFTR